ncbi:MAG: redoxin domain-containing protein [Verrucomicrobiota bacterium]
MNAIPKPFLSGLAAWIFLLALSLLSHPGHGAAEVGKPAPAFTLMNSNGEAVSLSDFKGKFVVLEWTSHACPFVKKFYQSGMMQEWQEAAAKKGVTWLTICSSGTGMPGHMTNAQWSAKIRESEIKSIVLIDEDGAVGIDYEAKTTPHMFVINPEGILIYAGAIDSKPSTHPEDIPTATNYVLTALEEAMAGKEVSTSVTPAYGCGVKYGK